MNRVCKIVDRIKDISLLQLLEMCYIFLIIYIAVDIGLKVNELEKYDVERLLNDVKTKYPNSHIRFQNIQIYGKDTYTIKQSVIAVSHSFYIRNNKLQPEGSNLLLMCSFIPVLVFVTLRQITNTVKIRELHKKKGTYYVLLIGCYLIGLFVFRDNALEKSFKKKTEYDMNHIDLTKYLKQ